jgi:gamma-glutamyltranspeptidase/glutathione hydrolase
VAAAPPASVAPEQATGWQAKPGWWFDHQAVAAANPLAAAAGAEMLRAGGSAVDAAVAVQMVLALVEPQSSGIGGGGFLLLWDGHALEAWDGRETAPAAATERLFLKPDGQPMAFADAVQGGRAVGVPGAVAMLEAVHRAHGRLPWPGCSSPPSNWPTPALPSAPACTACCRTARC